MDLTADEIKELDEDVRAERDSVIADSVPPNTAVVVNKLSKVYDSGSMYIIVTIAIHCYSVAVIQSFTSHKILSGQNITDLPSLVAEIRLPDI